MKKRFSAILMAVMMLLSFCSFTAFAGDETTTSLELTHYNIITNNIRLEFSSEVSNVTATLKSTDNNAITVTTEKDSTDSKIWDLKLSEKMDITKEYILNFTADTLTAQKLIKFNPIVNDDFSSYSSLADMTSNYVGKDLVYADKADNYDISTGVGTKDGEARTVDLGFAFDNENKRVKLTKSNIFLRTKANVTAYNTAEFDLTTEEETATNPPFILHTYTNTEYDENSRMWKLDLNGNGNILNIANYEFSDYGIESTRTFALTREKLANGTYIALYSNGKVGYAAVDTENKYSQYNSAFGISANGKNVYLDNLKIYTVSMVDYTELKLDYINVTTKGITVSYNDTLSGTPTVELLKGDVTVTTTVTKNDKALNIIPAERLDLNKKYILKVNASNGVSNCNISKLIEFDVIVDDDFDSYTQLSDLDDTYFIRLNDTATKISESNMVTLDNGKLKMALTGGHGFWVKSLAGAGENNRKYYNMEADLQYITPDGNNIGDGDLYYFNVKHTNFYINTSIPTEDVYLHIGYGHNIVNANSLFADGSKFSETKYNNNGTGTYAFSLTRDENNTRDVYSINENGKALVTASGTVKGNNFYYILGHPHSINHGTYYLDNYKLYAPILTDATTFPEFTTDGDALITSRYIKIDFNDEIDSSAENLANVKVTSLGSDLDVTKTVDGKTLTIAPTSGEFPFDREITYTIDGLKNTSGSTATYVGKSFKLQKLWYETFDNAETISDLYGKYYMPKSEEDVTTKTLKEYVETTGNENVFSIVSDNNGGKRLKMNNTGDYAFTHFEKYAGNTAGRNLWTDTITEFDFDTDDINANDFKFNYKMVYGGGVDENGIGKKWWAGGNSATLPSDSKSFKMTTVVKNTEEVNASGSKKTNISFYKDDECYKTVNGTVGAVGEFGFQNSKNSAVYIDNIKVYKVVDFTDSEHLWLTNTMAKTTTENDTETTTVSGTLNIVSYADNKAIEAGNAILVAYDSNEKIIGITTVATSTVSAKGNATATYNIPCSSKDVHRVSAFVWDSLDGMKPLIQNRSTTDITVAK